MPAVSMAGRATGRGIQYALREFFRYPEDTRLARLSGTLEAQRVIVRGLGNVGFHAAKFLSEEDGAVIVRVIQRDGAVTNPQAWRSSISRRISARPGREGLSGATYHEDGAAVPEAECDILIPAAMEASDPSRQCRAGAGLIIEAANGRSRPAPTISCASGDGDHPRSLCQCGRRDGVPFPNGSRT